MDREAILERLEETGAALSGHFELRSGLHSDRYFQCANLLMFPQVAAELCAALARRVREHLGPDPVADAVIAPALGGILVGYELARALGVRSIFVEKEGGDLAMRRFTIREGETFVVAEDVITRGGRVQETLDIVQGAGGRVLAVALVIDRSEGKAGFDVPTFSLLESAPVVWEPAECPLCARGEALTHPGSASPSARREKGMKN
ncbi:MAG: orotate phosphoribosyltransferase [Lentisphaerae bacterium]|nr:orotate phosphoribosyltransferase [Lentisphaerota bacterium]